MRRERPYLRPGPGGWALRMPASLRACGLAGALFFGLDPACAQTVLDPSNPSNFNQDGTQSFSTGTVLTLTDQSVGDRIALFASDVLATRGRAIDLVATFRFTQVAPANVDANNRLEINDGTHAVIAQCLVLPGGIRGIGLYAGGNPTEPASYPVFVPVDWQSAPAKIRLRRWANGDAELVEVNGVAPVPRALLGADEAPETSRAFVSVGFGLASFEARAVVEYSEFYSEARVVFADGFETEDDCGWNARPGSAHVCDVTVREIQTGESSGEVNVPFAVVTAFTADREHFWMADEHVARIYEGIFVDRGPSALPLDASFVVGSGVRVRGRVVEEGAGIAPNSLTKIVASDEPVDLGFAQLPVPAGMPAGYLSHLADLATGEPYEGVLVRVDLVEAGDTLSGNRVELVDAGDPEDLILLDDDAYLYGTIAAGTEFACVTGVLHLDSAVDERRLLPRSAADLAQNPVLCPPAFPQGFVATGRR